MFTYKSPEPLPLLASKPLVVCTARLTCESPLAALSMVYLGAPSCAVNCARVVAVLSAGALTSQRTSLDNVTCGAEPVWFASNRSFTKPPEVSTVLNNTSWTHWSAVPKSSIGSGARLVLYPSVILPAGLELSWMRRKGLMTPVPVGCWSVWPQTTPSDVVTLAPAEVGVAVKSIMMALAELGRSAAAAASAKTPPKALLAAVVLCFMLLFMGFVFCFWFFV